MVPPKQHLLVFTVLVHIFDIKNTKNTLLRVIPTMTSPSLCISAHSTGTSPSAPSLTAHFSSSRTGCAKPGKLPGSGRSRSRSSNSSSSSSRRRRRRSGSSSTAVVE